MGIPCRCAAGQRAQGLLWENGPLPELKGREQVCRLGSSPATPGTGQLQVGGKQMATQGGPPAPAQLVEMQRLQAKIRQGGVISAVLMVIAVIGMTW